MKTAKIFVILLVGSILIALPNDVTATMDFSVDDSFTIQFDTTLTGRSGDYEEYTESESDVRNYNVNSVSGSRVEMSMTREYSYSDSEWGSYSESTSHSFAINSSDGTYLDGSFDAPASYVDYFTFDYIWFRIDPTLSEGATLTILGETYTVNGLTSVFVDPFTAVEVIEVQALDISQLVDDPEYDPNGLLHLTIDDTYYFDPDTGYFIMEIWEAEVQTTLGRFSWYETGIVLESSYIMQVDSNATLGRFVMYFILILGFLTIIGLFNRARKSMYRSEVDKAIRIMAGEIKPPETKIKHAAPSLWKPLELDYHTIISDTPENELVTLQPGVFLVVDPSNKFAIVDTKTKPKFKNLVFDFDLSSLTLLYKLVLGTISRDTTDYNDVITRLRDVKDYIHHVTQPAAPDPHSFETFNRFEKEENPLFEEISYLMARRRVLDYSLGQAPLTPSSHILKLNHVMRHQPNDVLLVGDDDLLSVSLARRNVNVTVLEIDPYTCALISRIAEEDGLNIRIHQIDLRAALPFLQEQYDLFVADPDFAIEAFALFLSRGLSLLRIGGIGLINFQDKGSKRYQARYLLDKLNVEIVEESKEKWNYTIVINEKASSHYYGKYATVTYTKEVKLDRAPYSSVMYTIRRKENTELVLEAHENLKGAEEVIYDF